MPNIWDPGQAQCFARPDVGLNCLQRLPADDKKVTTSRLDVPMGTSCMHVSRGGTESGPSPPPMKNHKNIGFPNNIDWSGSPKNHKATKPAFNVGLSSAR